MPSSKDLLIVSLLLAIHLTATLPARAQTLPDQCFAIADGGSRGGAQDRPAEDFLALMDKVTGVESNVGFTGTFDIEALAYWPNSRTLYAANGGVLVRLEWMTDGRFTAIGAGIGSVNGPLGSISVTDVDGLAFDPTTSPPLLFGSVRRANEGENDLLIRIDTNTGQRVANAFGAGVDYLVVQNAITSGGAVCSDVEDLAFDPLDGSLFALQSDGGEHALLTRINPWDGGVIVVGPPGVDDAEGLTFDLEGNLFLSTGKNARNLAQRDGLYSVDKISGAATNRRAATKEDIEGISCFTANVSLIGDMIWRDDNRNGLREAGEPGLAGVTVHLLRAADGAILQTRITGADGAFLFAAPSGSYQMEAMPPAGYAISPLDAGGNDEIDNDLDPGTGRSAVFGVSINGSDTSRDGGMFCLPPVISCPPTAVLECPDGPSTNVTGVATATSPCGCPVTVGYQDSFAAGCGSTGIITRRWTATDLFGGSSHCDQVIQINDSTQPLLTGVPADTTASCDDIPPAPTVTASDGCDPLVEPVLTLATTPGACPQTYTLIRTWTATDDCGNARAASQVITVQDTTKPVVTGSPAAVTVTCAAMIPPVDPGAVTATDNCGPVTVTHLGDTFSGTTCNQSIQRSYQVTDACGNLETVTQSITVIDNIRPVQTGFLQDRILQCVSELSSFTPVPPVVVDNCDGMLPAPAPVILNDFSPLHCGRTRRYIWTFRDTCGNQLRITQTLFVRDTRTPTITCPTPPVLVCDGNGQATLPALAPSIADNCGAGGVTLTQSPPAGTVLAAPGSVLVTLTVRDACGNTNSCQVNVTATCGPPAVELAKTVYPGHNGGAFCPGGEILVSTNGAPVTYCFEVRNTGALNLANLVLSDPALGISNLSIGALAAGQSIMLHAESILSGGLTNLAAVAGTGPEGQPLADSDDAVVQRIAPALHLTQTVAYGADAPCPGQPSLFAVNGQPVTYCFQVTNTGDTPLERVRVELPGLNHAPLDAGMLAVGQSAMLKTWMSANGSATNLAAAIGLPTSGPPVRADATAVITALGPSGELIKTVYAGHDGGASCPGGETAFITAPDTPVTFCFTFRNSGDGLLADVALSDPALLIGSLPLAISMTPGAEANHVAEVLASAELLNTATVDFLPASGAPMTATGNATLALPAPGLLLEKKVAAGFAGHSGCLLSGENLLELPEAGPVTWCFVVRNTGNTWLSNISLADPVIGVSEADMEYTGPALPLAPGQEGVWHVTGRAEVSVRNQAVASGVPSAPDGTPVPGQPVVQGTASADVIVGGAPIP